MSQQRLFCPACQAEVQPGDQMHRKVSGVYSSGIGSYSGWHYDHYDSGRTQTDLAIRLQPPSKPYPWGPGYRMLTGYNQKVKALEQVMRFWSNSYYCIIHDHVWDPTLTLNVPSAFFQSQMNELTKAIQRGNYIVAPDTFAGQLSQELPDPYAGMKAFVKLGSLLFLGLFLFSVIVVGGILISEALDRRNEERHVNEIVSAFDCRLTVSSIVIQKNEQEKNTINVPAKITNNSDKVLYFRFWQAPFNIDRGYSHSTLYSAVYQVPADSTVDMVLQLELEYDSDWNGLQNGTVVEIDKTAGIIAGFSVADSEEGQYLLDYVPVSCN